MARQLQLKLPLFPLPRSHQEAMRRLLAARELRCELAPRVELVAACHAPLLQLAGVPICVRYIDWTLVMFHPDGTIGLDIGEMYHWPGAYRTIMDCMPEGWRLLRRRNTLYFDYRGSIQPWPLGATVTIGGSGRLLLEGLGRNDASGAADLDVPDNDPPAAISDAGWAELNRKFNELLMGRSS